MKVIDILEKRDNTVYIVGTASNSILGMEDYERWIKKENIFPFQITPFSLAQIELLIDTAAVHFKVNIEPDAKKILAQRSLGIPEHILGVFRYATSQRSKRLDSTLVELYSDNLWKLILNHLEKNHPGSIYIQKAIDDFKKAGALTFTTLILEYAKHIWRKERISKRPLLLSKKLNTGLQKLLFFGLVEEQSVVTPRHENENDIDLDTDSYLRVTSFIRHWLFWRKWSRLAYATAAAALSTASYRQQAKLVKSAEGKMKEALETLEEQKPLFEVFLNLMSGNFYFRLGDYEKALPEFEYAVQKANKFAEPHRGLFNVLMRLGRLDEAKCELNEISLLEPDHPDTIACFALYGLFINNFKEAFEKYNTAAERVENPLEYNFEKALVLFCLGRPKEGFICIKLKLDDKKTTSEEIMMAVRDFELIEQRNPKLTSIKGSIDYLKSEHRKRMGF